MVRTAFIVDPLARLDPATDTSVGLMMAAQDRGAEVLVTEVNQLEAVNGRARALARPLRLAPFGPAVGHRFTAAEPWYSLGSARNVWMDEMGAVFMRTEPPVDQAYLTATLILDLVDPSRTAMVNDPRGLRLCSEHLFPLRFPDLIPPTIVTADPRSIRSFLAEHGVLVVKPVDGFSGRGVLRLHRHDPNLASLIELCTGAGREWLMAQEYLPAAVQGDKRILLVDGEPLGAILRVPPPGEIRGNIHVGATVVATDLDADDLRICDALRSELRARGLWFVGLDVIGGKLTEVNVTSPTGIQELGRLSGGDPTGKVIDWLERHPFGRGLPLFQ